MSLRKLNIELNDLQLSNYRGFEELNLTFHPKLTVLIGENGAGKTAVLDAVASMLKTIEQIIKSLDTIGLTAGKETDIRRAEKVIEGKVELGLFYETEEKSVNKKSEEELSELRWEGSITRENYESDKLKSLGYKTEYELFQEKLRELRSEPDSLDDIDKFLDDQINAEREAEEQVRELLERPSFFNEIIDFYEFQNSISDLKLLLRQGLTVSLPALVYYPCYVALLSTNEQSNGQQAPVKYDIFDAYDNALTEASFDFKGFAAWFKWQENIGRETKGNKLLNTICQAIYSILGDGEEDTQFSNLHTTWLNNPNGDLVIEKEGAELLISQLSSGEKTLLALVADLARRLAMLNPKAENPLEGGGVVLIDEIDLHLHPRWQRKIVPRLQETFPNCQFVITTHSPHVLTTVDNDQIKILENSQVKDYTPPTKGRDTNSILLDIFKVKKRPEQYQEKLNEFYEYIDEEDEENAEMVLEELKGDWGEDDRAIRRAQSYLELL